MRLLPSRMRRWGPRSVRCLRRSAATTGSASWGSARRMGPCSRNPVSPTGCAQCSTGLSPRVEPGWWPTSPATPSGRGVSTRPTSRRMCCSATARRTTSAGRTACGGSACCRTPGSTWSQGQGTWWWCPSGVATGVSLPGWCLTAEPADCVVARGAVSPWQRQCGRGRCWHQQWWRRRRPQPRISSSASRVAAADAAMGTPRPCRTCGSRGLIRTSAPDAALARSASRRTVGSGVTRTQLHDREPLPRRRATRAARCCARRIWSAARSAIHAPSPNIRMFGRASAPHDGQDGSGAIARIVGRVDVDRRSRRPATPAARSRSCTAGSGWIRGTRPRAPHRIRRTGTGRRRSR